MISPKISPRRRAHASSENGVKVREYFPPRGSWHAMWIEAKAIPVFDFLNRTGIPRKSFDREVRRGRIEVFEARFQCCPRPVELVSFAEITKFNSRVVNGEFAHLVAEFLDIRDNNAECADPKRRVISKAESDAGLCS